MAFILVQCGVRMMGNRFATREEAQAWGEQGSGRYPWTIEEIPDEILKASDEAYEQRCREAAERAQERGHAAEAKAGESVQHTSAWWEGTGAMDHAMRQTRHRPSLRVTAQEQDRLND